MVAIERSGIAKGCFGEEGIISIFDSDTQPCFVFSPRWGVSGEIYESDGNRWFGTIESRSYYQSSEATDYPLTLTRTVPLDYLPT